MIPFPGRLVFAAQSATATSIPVPTPTGPGDAAGTQFTPENVLTAVVVLVVAYVLATTLSLVLSKLADRFAHRRFRVMFLIPIVKFVVYAGALYVVLSVLFELTQTQLVAFAGLLGAALGLGLKDLLADIVGGLVVVLEQPFQVGDKVQMGEYYGEVVDEAPATVVVEDDLYYRTITGKAYVNDLRSETDFRTDVTERVLDAFDEAGIESPKASGDLPER